MEMKNYKILVIILVGLVSGYLNSQVLIPPSPSASSIGVKSSTGVNLVTGQPEISIPIWEIDISGYNLPITLNYDASGRKVEEIASWVGLGWSLNTGGIITRIVRGYPDEIQTIDGTEGLRGYLHTYFWSHLYSNYECDNTACVIEELNKEIDIATIHSELNEMNKTIGTTDLEPDIFILNLNGRSVKFYFNKTLIPCLVSNTNIKIDPIFNESNTRIESFIVTDEMGIKYYFNIHETSTYTTTAYEQVSVLNGLATYFDDVNHSFSYRSSWYLSKIITPKSDEILFTYEDEEIEYSLRLINAPSGVSKIKFKVNPHKRLAEIKYDDHIVKFIPMDHDRDDLRRSYALNKIEILSNIGESIKKYKFKYSYFISPDDGSSLYESKSWYYKRLKLESITEFNNYEIKPPFIFEYNEIDILPQRMSCEQDIWGYYNANNATSLVPKIYIYPQFTNIYRAYPIKNLTINLNTSLTEYIKDGADRMPDIREVDGSIETVMDAFILEKIYSPAGGSTKYTYEPHIYNFSFEEDFYSDMENEHNEGGGLRIKIIEKNDGKGNKMIKRYKYEDENGSTSGRLVWKPTFANYDANSKIKNNNWTYSDLIEQRTNDPENYYKENISTYSFSQLYSGSLESPIVYNQVTEYIEGEGKIVYIFENRGLYGESDDSNGDNIFQATTIKNTIRQLNFDETVVKCEDDKNYSFTYCSYQEVPEMNIDHYSFPYAPSTNYDWNRGKLKLMLVYPENENYPIKRTEYEYDIFYKNGIDPERIFGLVFTKINVPTTMEPRCDICNAYRGQFYYYGIYDIVTGVSKLPVSIKEINYDMDHLGDINYAISNNALYTYNNFGQLKSITKNESDGSTLTTEYKYPLDYQRYDRDNCPRNIASAIERMADRNIINNPIETISKKNGRVINGILNLYKEVETDNRVNINLYKTLNLEINTPIIDIQPSSFNSFQYEYKILSIPFTKTCYSFDFDERYHVITNYDKYDSSGNLLQLHKENGINVSYIWGYNNTVPIAKVNNAKWNEIFYSSMEEDPGIYTWTDFSFDNTRSKTGKFSLKAEKPSTGEIYCYMPRLTIDNDNSVKYYYSGWVYSTATSVDLYFFHQNTNDSYLGTGWEGEYVRTSEKNKWVYIEGAINVPASKKCIYLRVDNNGSGTVWFDDLRLYPADANMTTYTYKPLIGITSETGHNNKSLHYKFDDLGRAILAKDHEGNVLNTTEYNYGRPFFFIEENTGIFDPSGNSKQFSIEKYKMYNCSISTSESWISYTKESENNSQITLTITTENNPTTTLRSGYVTISSLGKDGKYYNEKIWINQVGLGIWGYYFRDGYFNYFKYYKIDNNINFNWEYDYPDNLTEERFSIFWIGSIVPPHSGTYTFEFEVDDYCYLSIDGEKLIDNESGSGTYQGTKYLVGGNAYSFFARFQEEEGLAKAILKWELPGVISKQVIPKECFWANEPLYGY